MTVPYAFGSATSAIPLSQLDSNFNTPITLGNTAIQLGNTVTTLNNMTLANVTISSGNVTITNVSVTTANVTTGNVTNLITGNASITGGNISGVTLTLDSLDSTPVGATTPSTGAFTTLSASSTVTLSGGTANGVLYLNGSKVATSGSALTFDGTNLGVGLAAPTGSGTYRSINAGAALFYGNTASAIASLNNNADILDKYIVNGYASSYVQSSGNHLWYNAASGTAGAAITYTEQMRLTSTGLGIGTSSPSYKLDVYNAGAAYIRASRSTQAAGDVGFILNGGTSGTSWNIYQAASSNNLAFFNGSGDKLTLDSSGNLGLGVTPSAWVSYKALQIAATGGGLASSSSSDLEIVTNAYYSGGWLSQGAGVASSRYRLNAGTHAWYTAPSGTAGDAISFTQAMTLDASGNLGIGTSSPGAKLDVIGTIRVNEDGAGT